MPKTQCLFNLFLEPEAKTYSPCVRVITASKKVVKVLSEFLLGSHVNLMLQHAELSLSLTKIPNLFLLIYEISLFSLLVTSTIIHQKIILKLCFYSSVSVMSSTLSGHCSPNPDNICCRLLILKNIRLDIQQLVYGRIQFCIRNQTNVRSQTYGPLWSMSNC